LGNFSSLANSARSKGNKLSDAPSNNQWDLSTQGRENNEYRVDDYSGVAAGWRLANLALQLGLGILSGQRSWVGSPDYLGFLALQWKDRLGNSCVAGWKKGRHDFAAPRKKHGAFNSQDWQFARLAV